ncbi:MAG: septum formation initiator family protein [bacterium]|nr:septum formation initiator family protein [bacterium]
MRRIYIKRNHRGLFAVGILVFVICSVFYYNTAVLEAKIQSRKEEVASLENSKKNLLETQESLKDSLMLTDEDIEKIAREKLNLVYPDEIILKSDK